MVLLDEFVVTTEQQTNLKLWSVWENPIQKLSVCFNKSTKSNFCLIQQFLSGIKDSKKEVRKLRMIAGVEPSLPKLCAFPDLL